MVCMQCKKSYDRAHEAPHICIEQWGKCIDCLIQENDLSKEDRDIVQKIAGDRRPIFLRKYVKSGRPVILMAPMIMPKHSKVQFHEKVSQKSMFVGKIPLQGGTATVHIPLIMVDQFPFAFLTEEEYERDIVPLTKTKEKSDENENTEDSN